MNAFGIKMTVQNGVQNYQLDPGYKPAFVQKETNPFKTFLSNPHEHIKSKAHDLAAHYQKQPPNSEWSDTKLRILNLSKFGTEYMTDFKREKKGR